MKKKVFILLLMVPIIGITIVKSQCTPDANCNQLFCPDTFKSAIATVIYNEITTIAVPSDTSIVYQTIPFNDIAIDCVGVTNIKGLPTGFSYQSNPSSGYVRGGHKGCILLTGNPIVGQVGVYPITIYIRGSIAGFYVFTDSAKMEMEILDASTDIEKIQSSEFRVIDNYPNPFLSQTEIIFSTSQVDDFTFGVYNILGENIYKEYLKATKGINRIIFKSESLSSGIYFYKISNNSQSITKRMVVSTD
jgi:hypothetical protein